MRSCGEEKRIKAAGAKIVFTFVQRMLLIKLEKI
jgi:hypothetical protein